MRRVLVFLTVVFVLGVVIDLGAARAPSTFNVPDGDVPGLISAINSANANPGPDTINLASGGSYVLVAGYDANNGLPPIVDALTISGNGATIARSSVAGTPNFRILLISAAGAVTISDVTIGNGKGTGDFQGGAIRNFQSTLNIIGSSIVGSSAAFGGGIFSYRSVLNITDSFISGNVSDDPVAGGVGGGIYNYQGTVTITDSSVSGNYSRNAGGIFNYQGPMTLVRSEVSANVTPGTGGGMTVYESSVDVIDSTVLANSATYGAGIVNFGVLRVNGSTLSDNVASRFGGAIYSLTGGTLTVKNSTVSDNSAHSDAAPTSGYGGGIYNSGGSTATVANSTIAGNFTNFGGGGIYNNGTMVVTNVTIFGNKSVQYGSGLLNDSSGSATFRNTILAGNYLGRNCNYAFGPAIVSQGHNLSDDGTCASAFVQTGDMNNMPAGLDPAGLQNNGGPTETVALEAGSPAIDAGDDAICAAAPVGNLDQRGEPRPAGAHCDIGAYEAEPSDATPPVVTCASPDGAWHPANVTLSCTASDDGSGLLDAADASFSLTTGVAAGIEDGNASTDSRTVCDNAGNCSEAGPIGGNKIDRRAPVVSITAPATTAYTLQQAVASNYGCSDGGSGVSGCAGPVASGANIDTSSAGTHTFSVTATDTVGNTATSSVTYTVGYGVCVLFDQSKAHKAGSTIPIKLGLCDATGANVSSPSVAVLAASVYLVSTSAPGPLADSGNANPDYQFRFSDGSYIFNLSLVGFAQGTYALTFTAGSDPTPHVVQFQVK